MRTNHTLSATPRAQPPEPVVDDRGVVERELGQRVDAGARTRRGRPAAPPAAPRAARAPCRRSTAASRAGRAPGRRRCAAARGAPSRRRSSRAACARPSARATPTRPTNPPGSANIPRWGSSSRRASSTLSPPSSSVKTTGSAVRPIGASYPAVLRAVKRSTAAELIAVRTSVRAGATPESWDPGRCRHERGCHARTHARAAGLPARNGRRSHRGASNPPRCSRTTCAWSCACPRATQAGRDDEPRNGGAEVRRPGPNYMRTYVRNESPGVHPSQGGGAPDRAQSEH